MIFKKGIYVCVLIYIYIAMAYAWKGPLELVKVVAATEEIEFLGI